MISILGAGSPLNKFELIDIELSRNSKTVYVDLLGNDLTGDGSQGKPFKTIAKALLELTGTIRYVTISLNAGVHKTKTFTVTKGCVNFDGDGSIDFNDVEYGRLMVLDNARAVLNVGVTNSATAALFASLGNSSIIEIHSTVCALTGVVELFSNDIGQNSVALVSVTVTSDVSCVKFASTPNTEPVAMYEAGVTYTNIT